MRRLMLLRHAKSDRPAGVPDHERPLARSGREACDGIGQYMAREGLAPDLAIVSSARRTQETWDLVRRAFAGNLHYRGEPRIYEATADAILAIVRETAPHVERLLLVGHNPGLQDLALELIGKGSRPELSRLRAKYPTAGLVVIDFDVPSWNRLDREAGTARAVRDAEIDRRPLSCPAACSAAEP